MILIGRFRSPFVRRVGVTLELLGMAYEQRKVSALANAETVRAYNPLGLVPALVLDDGETLIDSRAIVDHLIGEGGHARVLMPESGRPRRRAMKAIALMIGAQEQFIAAVYERTRRPEETIHGPWLALCEERARSGLDALEQMAGENEWLAGETMTQADIVAAIGLTFIDMMRPDFAPPEQRPELERIRSRCEAHPAMVATRPEA